MLKLAENLRNEFTYGTSTIIDFIMAHTIRYETRRTYGYRKQECKGVGHNLVGNTEVKMHVKN